MKILVTGGSGALGSALQRGFRSAYFPKRKEMDVTDPDSVRNAIGKYKPDCMIHLAALVGIRECEENKKLAWETNVEGTQHVVDALKEYAPSSYLIYVSTACVFAGEKEKYYTEEDIPSPKNYYSLTKLCGEIVTRQHENHCIIRTNFVPKTQWKYPGAFADRFGTYLFAENVAWAIREIIEKKPNGIIHIVGDKRMSMHDLAILAGSRGTKKMTLDEYSGPPLTVDMSLSTKNWKKYKIS